MADYYEEERREKASRVLGLAGILRTVADRLQEGSGLPGGQALDMVDEALNELVAVLGFCSPLAHRRALNGKLAFMWVEPCPNDIPTFQWIVCSPGGSCISGNEPSQQLCEEAVDRLLQ